LIGISEISGRESRAEKLADLFSASIQLPEFSSCLLGLLCVQYWAGLAAMLVRSFSIDSIVSALTQVSVLPVLEWYILFGMPRQFGNRHISPRLALGSLAIIIAATTLFHHQRFAFFVEAIALCIVWFRTPGLRRTAFVLLMIALQLGYGMTPLHGLASWCDARLVGAMMAMIGQPVMRIGNLLISPGMPDGLLVLAGCASTNLMAPMGLGLVALLLVSRKRLLRTDYYWIAATLAAGVAVNLVRIALMLQSNSAYESWHTGAGSSVISVLGLLITIVAWMAATGRPAVARR
jgi:exosortase/archaeosortase family protein